MNREHQQEIDRNTLLHSTTATVAEKEDALDRLLEASYKDGLDNGHESGYESGYASGRIDGVHETT